MQAAVGGVISLFLAAVIGLVIGAVAKLLMTGKEPGGDAETAARAGLGEPSPAPSRIRITSYNVCYTKLLRTTGKPKGIVHTTGGYLTQVTASTRYVFDLRDEDVFWCTADVVWITGHSYVVYGPLANGITVLMSYNFV